jgi:endonuclease-3
MPQPCEKILDVMTRVAQRRGAPVFVLKDFLYNSYQHLISAVLSSRTRDEATVEAGRRLFAEADTPEQLAALDVHTIEALIWGVGFYRVKARLLHALAARLVEEHQSRVPLTMEQLVSLPGVGRKTASIVLSASGIPAIAVDTHVHRISNRMGFVRTTTPVQTESALKELVDNGLWNRLNKAVVGFGQTLCKPIRPLCHECPFDTWCPKIGVKASYVEGLWEK